MPIYNPTDLSKLPVVGTTSFFFYGSVASSIATYFVEQQTASVGAASTITTAGLAAGSTTLINFATIANFPNITFQQPGIVSVYITARKSAGTKDVALYAEIYQRNLAGTETLICTTAKTAIITGVDSAYEFQGTIPTGVVFLATDRYVTKIRAFVSGGGSAPTVVLTSEDATAARCDMPTATVSALNFLPYTGATQDVDMGSKNLTTTGNIIGNLEDEYQLAVVNSMRNSTIIY